MADDTVSIHEICVDAPRVRHIGPSKSTHANLRRRVGLCAIDQAARVRRRAQEFAKKTCRYRDEPGGDMQTALESYQPENWKTYVRARDWRTPWERDGTLSQFPMTYNGSSDFAAMGRLTLWPRPAIHLYQSYASALSSLATARSGISGGPGGTSLKLRVFPGAVSRSTPRRTTRRKMTSIRVV